MTYNKQSQETSKQHRAEDQQEAKQFTSNKQRQIHMDKKKAQNKDNTTQVREYNSQIQYTHNLYD